MIEIATAHRKTTARLVGQAVMVILWAAAARTVAAPGEATKPVETEPAIRQRAERLQEMRAKVAQFSLARSKTGDDKSIHLRPDPIFRYSDQPRGFLDATLWAWETAGGSGRPVAIAKVELAIDETKTPFWQFCIASLADEPITADFAKVRRLNAAKPGFDLRPVPKAPQPADKPASRARQMKEIVTRFAATIDAKHLDKDELVKQEMRLLPSPIHRYADELNSLQDGMIFGLTTNGTNPDMLLVIELRGTELAASVWKYGVVKMTDADVHVRLDSKEVWVSLLTEPRETWEVFEEIRRKN